MCRLAAYLGPPIALNRFLTEPDRSLVVQSWDPQELVYTRVNADGYGFGWYQNDGAPACYRYELPIWADPNLADLGATLHAPLWLAMVRSATPGSGNGIVNTQPFKGDELLFTHNGYLGHFTTLIRPRIRALLSPEVEAEIHGSADSEYIFALIRELRRRNGGDLPAAVREALTLIGEWNGTSESLINLVISDGQQLLICRHAVAGPPPSLYYSFDHPRYPKALVVASEPLTSDGDWCPFPEHALALVTQPAVPDTSPLN